MIMLLQYTRHIRLTFICNQRISGEKQPDFEPTGSLLNVMICQQHLNPVLYPSIDTILCVLLTMPVVNARSFSVLRCQTNYVRSTMKNDRLSSLDWCIFVEILKWTCTKQWRCLYLLKHEGQILDNCKKFLSIKVITIVLDSILYETLKWPQIAPFCISSKNKSQTPSPSQELWRAHY